MAPGDRGRLMPKLTPTRCERLVGTSENAAEWGTMKRLLSVIFGLLGLALLAAAVGRRLRSDKSCRRSGRHVGGDQKAVSQPPKTIPSVTNEPLASHHQHVEGPLVAASPDALLAAGSPASLLLPHNDDECQD